MASPVDVIVRFAVVSPAASALSISLTADFFGLDVNRASEFF